MNDLRRLVWRYKAGNVLREKLRDRFLEEIDQMRWRCRKLARQLGCDRPAGRLPQEFDRACADAERDARAARFPAALELAASAADLLEKLEEICLALSAIADAEAKILELETLLGNVPFAAIEDVHILMIRARGYYESGKYRTARFIAEDRGKYVARITVAAPDGQDTPSGLPPRLGRLRAMADSLDRLGIGQVDAARIRAGAAAIETVLSKRYFELAEALTGDMESVTAPIETFLSQLSRSAGKSHVIPFGERIDWRGASASLTAESLADVSRRLASRALAAASNG